VEVLGVYEFEGRRPRIGEGTYISHSADVIGDVVIGRECFIGPGARIKGDYGSVRIGNKTNIQENCVVHARPGEICVIGDWVSIGHGAIVHNCTIRDYAVIGMGAIVSDYATVGTWAIVGEGCLVKSKQEVPDRKIAVGVPAKVIGDVTEEHVKLWTRYKEIYVSLARRYREKLREVNV